MIGRALVGAGLLLLAPAPARAFTVTVTNLDDPGEGLNDPTPFTPIGGNAAHTLGEARLVALRYAAGRWAAQLHSDVPVEITVHLDPQTCTSTTAILGAAGATSVHYDFPGAPLSGTLYPQALANALAGVDLAPGTADISATFNSQLDTGSCLGGTKWYYGLDGNERPNTIDFVTVALHELAHGLGFITFVDPSTGARAFNRNDVFLTRLEDHGAMPADFPSMTNAQRVTACVADPLLHWVGPAVNAAAPALLTAGINGGHVRMYGPNPLRAGSSVSHFSTDLFPNELLEPFHTGPNHDLTLTTKLIVDLGWTTGGASVAAPALSPRFALALAALLLALTGVVRATGERRRPSRALTSCRVPTRRRVPSRGARPRHNKEPVGPRGSRT